MLDAQKVNMMRLRGEKLGVKDLKAIIMFVIPASGSTEAPSLFNTRHKMMERLSLLEKDWWEYLPEPELEQPNNDSAAPSLLLKLSARSTDHSNTIIEAV